MHPLIILQLLFLLMVANGTPVIAKKLLGSRGSYPLDGGVGFIDGRPLFGTSKTIRGILLAIVATAAAASVIGLGWTTGLLVGGTAMAGDLFSSFVKRRLNLQSSSRAVGLDQVPESLFPLLACRAASSPALASTPALTLADVVATVALFFVGEVLLSQLLYKLRLRDRPY